MWVLFTLLHYIDSALSVLCKSLFYMGFLDVLLLYSVSHWNHWIISVCCVHWCSWWGNLLKSLDLLVRGGEVLLTCSLVFEAGIVQWYQEVRGVRFVLFEFFWGRPQEPSGIGSELNSSVSTISGLRSRRVALVFGAYVWCCPFLLPLLFLYYTFFWDRSQPQSRESLSMLSRG
jgi:hypothetical protein